MRSVSYTHLAGVPCVPELERNRTYIEKNKGASGRTRVTSECWLFRAFGKAESSDFSVLFKLVQVLRIFIHKRYQKINQCRGAVCKIWFLISD